MSELPCCPYCGATMVKGFFPVNHVEPAIEHSIRCPIRSLSLVSFDDWEIICEDVNQGRAVREIQTRNDEPHNYVVLTFDRNRENTPFWTMFNTHRDMEDGIAAAKAHKLSEVLFLTKKYGVKS